MKKIIIFLFIMMAGIACACPTEDVFKLQLKKSLFNYLQNPETSRLTIYEVKDLLTAYLTEDIAAENCSLLNGSESGLTISTILLKADRISDNDIPRCSDGTMYGECSSKQPMFCYAGMLKFMCFGLDNIYGNSDDCGCPGYQVCDPDGSCRTMSINCYSDNDCGTSTFVGARYCQDNNVYQDYINFTCKQPGTASSNCTFINQNILIEDCLHHCSGGVCT